MLTPDYFVENSARLLVGSGTSRSPSDHFEGRDVPLNRSSSAEELGNSDGNDECPDIWQLDNGDVAVIGRDLTAAYRARLPHGVHLAPDERLVVIPGNMLSAAKKDIPDA